MHRISTATRCDPRRDQTHALRKLPNKLLQYWQRKVASLLPPACFGSQEIFPILYNGLGDAPPKMPFPQGVLTCRLTGPTSAGVLQRHKISRQSRISDLAPDRIKSVPPAEHTPYSRRLCLTSSTNRKRKYNTVCHVLSVLQTTFLDCQDYILHCCQTRTEARLPATCR